MLNQFPRVPKKLLTQISLEPIQSHYENCDVQKKGEKIRNSGRKELFKIESLKGISARYTQNWHIFPLMRCRPAFGARTGARGLIELPAM